MISVDEVTYANERSIEATSRSGERFWRRSNSGRAGSPSKSMITQPPGVWSVWPRWKSPWVRIARPPTPSWVRDGDPLADVLAAAGDRGDALVVGQANEDPLDVLVDRRGQQRQ